MYFWNDKDWKAGSTMKVTHVYFQVVGQRRRSSAWWGDISHWQKRLRQAREITRRRGLLGRAVPAFPGSRTGGPLLRNCPLGPLQRLTPAGRMQGSPREWAGCVPSRREQRVRHTSMTQIVGGVIATGFHF